jgi:hypothetical protein
VGNTAQFHVFGPFFRYGVRVDAPRLFHYLPGSSTTKDAWLEREKINTADQPIVGDADGLVSAFFDGLYKIVITLSDGVTVIRTWNNYLIVEGQQRLEGSLIWDPGNLSAGAGETSVAIPVADAELNDYVLVAAPYDLQGLTATAYVDATGSVKIRLQNGTAGAVNLVTGTWTVRILRA